MLFAELAPALSRKRNAVEGAERMLDERVAAELQHLLLVQSKAGCVSELDVAHFIRCMMGEPHPDNVPAAHPPPTNDVVLSSVSDLSTEELIRYVVMDYPGPVLGRAQNRPRITHGEIHEQVRMDLLRRGVDVVHDEMQRLARTRNARRKRRRRSPLTPARIAQTSTDALLWYFRVWAQRPPIGEKQGVVGRKTKTVLENIASELVERRVPLPCPMPRTMGAPARKRGTRRAGVSWVASTTDARMQVFEGLAGVMDAVGRRKGAQDVASAATMIMAEMVQE